MSLLTFGTHFYLEMLRLLLVIYVLGCAAVLLLRAPHIGNWLRSTDETVREQAAARILPLTRRLAYGLAAIALVSVIILVITLVQYIEITNEFPNKRF